MGLDSWADALLTLPSTRHDELVTFSNRLLHGVTQDTPAFVGSRHYYRSDYHVFHRPAFFTAVRMYSAFTFVSDCGVLSEFHAALR